MFSVTASVGSTKRFTNYSMKFFANGKLWWMISKVLGGKRMLLYTRIYCIKHMKKWKAILTLALDFLIPL